MQTSDIKPPVKKRVSTEMEEIKSELAKRDNLVNTPPVLTGSRAFKHLYPSYWDANELNWDYDLIVTATWALNFIEQEKPSNVKLIQFEHEKEGEEKTKDKCLKERFLHMLVQGKWFDMEIMDFENSSHRLATTFIQNGTSVFLPLKNEYEVKVMNFKGQWLMKKSHIYWPDQKTWQNLEFLSVLATKMKDKGLKIDEYDQELLEERIKEREQWAGVPGAGVNLNQTSEKFLEKPDQLLHDKVIPHDDIHKLVMFNSVPVYTRILVEEGKAMCSKAKFEALTQQEKDQDVMEEAMVLALERCIFPGYVKSSEEAYRIGLIKVCTTVTKGWFRDYAIDAFPRICKCPRPLMEIAKPILDKYKKIKQEEEILALKNRNPAELLKQWNSKFTLVPIDNKTIYSLRKMISDAKEDENKIIGVLCDSDGYCYCEDLKYYNFEDEEAVIKNFKFKEYAYRDEVYQSEIKVIILYYKGVEYCFPVWRRHGIKHSGDCSEYLYWKIHVGFAQKVTEIHYNYPDFEDQDDRSLFKIVVKNSYNGSYGGASYNDDVQCTNTEKLNNSFLSPLLKHGLLELVKVLVAVWDIKFHRGGNIILKSLTADKLVANEANTHPLVYLLEKEIKSTEE